MPKFRVTSGKHHENGNVYKPGDIVELPYVKPGLKDRFEPVEEDKKVLRRRKAVEEGPYNAFHRGGGRYIVATAPDEKPVHDGYLNKKTADQVAKEFNLDADAEKEDTDATTDEEQGEA